MLPYPHPTWFPPGVEAVERAGRYITHPHVLPPSPPGGVAPQRLVQNTHSGSNSFTASTHPERRRPSPFHAGFIIQRRPEPVFIPIIWGLWPAKPHENGSEVDSSGPERRDR